MREDVETLMVGSGEALRRTTAEEHGGSVGRQRPETDMV